MSCRHGETELSLQRAGRRSSLYLTISNTAFKVRRGGEDMKAVEGQRHVDGGVRRRRVSLHRTRVWSSAFEQAGALTIEHRTRTGSIRGRDRVSEARPSHRWTSSRGLAHDEDSRRCASIAPYWSRGTRPCFPANGHGGRGRRPGLTPDDAPEVVSEEPAIARVRDKLLRLKPRRRLTPARCTTRWSARSPARPHAAEVLLRRALPSRGGHEHHEDP